MEHAQIAAADAAPASASFTVETKALADAVAFLAKRVTERRNTIPILSHIAFMVDLPGRVTITATDLDNFVSVEIAADVTTPGDFTADASALADIVAKLGKVKGSYSVGIEDKGDRVRVYAGRNEYKLKRLPIDDFPALDLSDPTPLAFTLPAARFLSDLAALAPCISKEESRYYLNGVALQVRDLGGRDRFAMVATDGHKIGVASRELPAGAGALPDVILPRKAAAILGHAAKLSPTCDALGVKVYQDRGSHKFRFTLGGVSIECKAIDGTFPDWMQLWGEGGNLAPTGEALPMFPELLPAAPLTHMQALEKATKAAIAWEATASGMMGTLPDDSGIVFGAIQNARAGLEPVKGFHVSFDADQGNAQRYLTALADQRAGRTVAREKCHLMIKGGEVLGLTVGNSTFEKGHHEDRHNWETLHVEKVWIEGRNVYETGAYSEVMPRERAKMRPDVTLEIDGDATVYPLGVKSGAIHLTKDQVRAIAGDSVFQTMAIEIAGRTIYILQWLWDQGDSRFLTVRPDGRTFKGGEIVTRAEIEAAMRGEIVEPAPLPEIAATEPAQSESAPIAAQENPEAAEALQEPEAPAMPVQDLDAITARLDALEQALATLSAVSAASGSAASNEGAKAEDTPTARAKRTPAHQRAIRRAWAERKARRAARKDAEHQKWMADNLRNHIGDMEARIGHAIAAADAAGEAMTIMGRATIRQKERRLATAQRARRMIAAARAQIDLKTRALDITNATVARLKSSSIPASEIARLEQERDTAQTALAAMVARAERAEQGIETMGERFASLVGRLSKAEAALQGRAA